MQPGRSRPGFFLPLEKWTRIPPAVRMTSLNLDSAQRRLFRRRLLRWFGVHQRRLPWRSTRNPYRVWLSEVMLQQTRVAAVLEHYRAFLLRFPNLRALAAARPADVLAAWSGLGYYRRARALHAAARLVVRSHGGRLPRNAEALTALPGIGDYTAAAVASIAFGERLAVVDGNVERVLGRLLGGPPRPRRRLWPEAEKLLSPFRPGDHNQAMMELGATVCLPRQPRCDACPVSKWCTTRGPLPSEKKPEARHTRRVGYVLAENGRAVYLVRRSSSDSLMPGMWELPALPPGDGPVKPSLLLRHSITNTDYDVSVLRTPAAGGNGKSPAPGGRWVDAARLRSLPLTGLARKVLRRFELL